jgi:hypothetical protein
MNMLHALPEQHPTEKKRRPYALLLTVLLASLLLLALIFAFPILMSLPGRRLTSSDWSGYSVSSDLNNPQPKVTSVNASWTVPTVNVSVGDSFSAVWIGVGGQFDDTLIQTGTEQDSPNGQGAYSAWYELLPYNQVTIDSLSVSPGDEITTSISLLEPATNTWSIAIHDFTSGQSFQKSLVYISSMLSAEWIVERPTVNNRIRTLADFSEITFTGCTATIDGNVGTISSFPTIQVTMYNRQNVKLVSVSPLTAKGSSFTVNYLD